MTLSTEILSQCWFLAGPTACGKTAVSLCLAEKINAEIVALDSMTLYRGMDIGTAKPTRDQQSIVRHHLIDVLNPEDEFSLADYIQMAGTVCREIIARGRTPLFVGGTGLYLRGLLRGVFEGPAADWSLRNQFEEIARRDGPLVLWSRLQGVDPDSAGRLHPNDQRRIIRALEVFELTGQPLSKLQTQQARPASEQPKQVFWISPPREWLYQRVDDRVDQMIRDGLVAEVKTLMSRPEGLSHTARQGLGYKEVIDWLEAHERQPGHVLDQGGRHPRPVVSEVVQLIKTRTHQFAKRQHTWFRNLEECRPIAIAGEESPPAIAEAIFQASLSPPRSWM